MIASAALLVAIALFARPSHAQDAAGLDTTPHQTRLVGVAEGVDIEVVDWGGVGPGLVFLSGLGDTAHAFDKFAPKFTKTNHVYGLTRRGFGRSSVPPPTDANYDANRLGDDVVAIVDALKLDKPILVGHSIGGSELSSVGDRYPDKVSGLIYLDAAHHYAFYTPSNSLSWLIDAADLRRTFVEMGDGDGRSQKLALLKQSQTIFAQLQKTFETSLAALSYVPPGPVVPPTKSKAIRLVMAANFRRHTEIRVPTLAIFATPPQCAPNCDQPGVKALAENVRLQADAFEAAIPAARVVRLPNASHYVYRSNEADVEREMNAFLTKINHK